MITSGAFVLAEALRVGDCLVEFRRYEERVRPCVATSIGDAVQKTFLKEFDVRGLALPAVRRR
jgi:hypothetical protein